MSVFNLMFIILILVVIYPLSFAGALFYNVVYSLCGLQFFGGILLIRGGIINYFTDFKKLVNNFSVMLIIVVALAGMSGLPPFFCFWCKISVAITFFNYGSWFYGGLVIGGGLVMLYFYFQNYRFMRFVKEDISKISVYTEEHLTFISFFAFFLCFLNCFSGFLIGDY
jgi:NADH:ubiquinone oxidoreductase subunit 2 (subunit N)